MIKSEIDRRLNIFLINIWLVIVILLFLVIIFTKIDLFVAFTVVKTISNDVTNCFYSKL